MKNLFFKEMKLAFHPIIWIFVFAFPFMILIPNYPLFITFIYICSTYPILFLGANKGVQSNDLTYTCLLPIKKSDAVKARMLTVIFIQAITSLVMICLSPLANIIRESIRANAVHPEEYVDVGFGVGGLPTIIGLSLFTFSIFDLIYFTLFYKNGRSILLGTFVGLFAFMIVDGILTLALPLALPDLKTSIESNWWIQAIIVGVCLLIYAFMHILTFKISAKELERVDL